jgi:cell wall assembly regulator SMI1
MKYVDRFRTNWRRGVTQSGIDQVEDNLRIKLPDDLRSHYRKVNGGIPKKNRFRCGDDIYPIHEIMPLRRRDVQQSGISLEETYQQHCIDQKNLNKYLLPFAIDEGGNWYCVSLKKRDRGAVYFVTDEEILSRLPFRKVANSFAELIEGLS